MIDDVTAGYRATAVSGVTPRQENNPDTSGAAPEKSAFRQTLDEIRDKGFRAYVDDMQAAKLAEMRREILESMGISDDDLAHMSPEKRAAVEAMVEQKIRQQLSTNTLIEKAGKPDELAPGELADHMDALPNGLGMGLLMARALEPTPDGDGGTG